MTGKPIVHIKPEVTRNLLTSVVHQSVIPGHEVERVQGALEKARTAGYEARDIPDDGRDHPYWGGADDPRLPCPVCNQPASGQTPGWKEIEFLFTLTDDIEDNTRDFFGAIMEIVHHAGGTTPDRWEFQDSILHSGPGAYVADSWPETEILDFYLVSAVTLADLVAFGEFLYDDLAAKASVHDRIVTPDTDPDRFTREDAAMFRAGKCGWTVEFGTARGEVQCGKPSKKGASFGNCAEHDAELLECYYPDGTRRGL
jgi:hypothetical protein